MNFSLIDFTKIEKLLTYQKDQQLLFNSGLFLVLFSLFYGVYVLLRNKSVPRNVWVILFSLFFYYKSNGAYFLLLLLSTVVDYSIGILIDDAIQKWKRKIYLMLSVVFNLGILSYFKYTNMLIDTANALFSLDFQHLDIFLPVGVSFFTFQTMSYAIDVYRRDMPAERNFLNFTFFVTFFPQLFAGPIVRAYDFLPQLKHKPILTQENLGKALFLIMVGLVKKGVIADYISINFVDRVFKDPLLYSGFENLIAVYGYSLQIYLDFSGYTDMAIGLALIMGYKFVPNFDAPYQSASITEFWRRWHMSLSSWLRDYLYISLGGNRKGKFRQYINLMLTMLLGGLWHGASWKYMMWGGIHGVALALDKLRMSIFKNVKGNGFTRVLGILFTFHLVVFCWIYFRADSFESAGEVINQIVYKMNWELAPDFFYGYQKVVWMLFAGYVLHFTPKRWDDWAESAYNTAPMVFQTLVFTLVLWIVYQSAGSEIQPFIYFQF